MTSILDHYISKIEGHGQLKYSLSEGRVRIEIDEGERLFEKLVIGQKYQDVPFITARICGVCPTSHDLAAILAIENAFGIITSDNIKGLRRALQAAQIVQSHALHLFFLALPDYLRAQNSLELYESNPRVFRVASELKKTADHVIQVVGGRAVHPVTPTVGGFLRAPTKKATEALVLELRAAGRLALEALDLFAGFKYPYLKRESEYFSLSSKGRVDILGDTLISSGGVSATPDNYTYVISERVVPYSTAKFATHNNHGMMVGAIARVNLMKKEDFCPKAQKAIEELGLSLPLTSSFKNNVAQALEIVHFLEEAERSLTSYLQSKGSKIRLPYRVKAGTGVGAIEAPRGTLYHSYEFDEKGYVRNCDIITPTVQNLTNLEDDANEYLAQNKQVTIPKRQRELEMLVRAYDPCITCSVH